MGASEARRTRPTRRPGGWLAIALAVAVTAAGCDSDSEATTTVAAPVVAALTDAEIAEVLAVAVPAAIVANPDGLGRLVVTDYEIADTLAEVETDMIGDTKDWWVVAGAGGEPIPDTARAAISDGLWPGTAVFVPFDDHAAMLIVGRPIVEDNTVVVVYEQRCGGEPGALCGSGGAFRLEPLTVGWEITEVLSSWIS